MEMNKEDTSKSPEPQKEIVVVKKAPKNSRDLRCTSCGKIVKVGYYICDDDDYTCGGCKDKAKKKEAEINEANDKRASGETTGAVLKRKKKGRRNPDSN